MIKGHKNFIRRFIIDTISLLFGLVHFPTEKSNFEVVFFTLIPFASKMYNLRPV